MPQDGREQVAVTHSTWIADVSDSYNRLGRSVPATRAGIVATGVNITEPSRKVDPFSGSGQGRCDEELRVRDAFARACGSRWPRP